MTHSLPSILEHTRGRVAELRRRRHELERAARDGAAGQPWKMTFSSDTVSVIAEIKRRSPSAGSIAERLDPALVSAAYERGGAGAISVLTEPDFFGGSIDDLAQVRRSVGVPVLRKDFVLDPLQVLEARAVGASAVLLIVRALGQQQLAELMEAASGVGLGYLVEVHSHAELEVALAVGASVIGVNSRDLDRFTIDVDGIGDILKQIPPSAIAVAESGLMGRNDVVRVADWGADAILVGTHFARHPNPESAVREMVGVPRRGRSS